MFYHIRDEMITTQQSEGWSDITVLWTMNINTNQEASGVSTTFLCDAIPAARVCQAIPTCPLFWLLRFTLNQNASDL